MSTTTLSPSNPTSSNAHSRRRRSRSPNVVFDSPNETSQDEPSPEEQSRFGFLLTPVLFLSFIISLVLIDRRTRSTIHPPTRSCDARCDKEDYYHTRLRKIARMEIGQAFEMRDWVLRTLGLGVGAGILGTAGAGGWWLWGRGS